MIAFWSCLAGGFHAVRKLNIANDNRTFANIRHKYICLPCQTERKEKRENGQEKISKAVSFADSYTKVFFKRLFLYDSRYRAS